MAPSWNNTRARALWTAILSLEKPSETAAFFRDLLTIPEIQEFANRWEAANMLDRGLSYAVITEKTGLSSRTVARIARWLNRGMGGYRLVLARQAHHHRPARPRHR